jgi:formate dehydrogenase accessory protein FdhD
MSTDIQGGRNHARQSTPAPQVQPRGPILPRVDGSRLAPHLPTLGRIRIEINGVLAGTPMAIPDAVTELAIGWAFLNRFFIGPGQLGKFSMAGSRVSLMIEGGADLDRCKYEAIGWIEPDEENAGEAGSERPARSVPMISGLDLISTCKAAFARFEDDGAAAGYVHAALANADDVLCIARDGDGRTAATKILGWTVTNSGVAESSMLITRGILDADIVDAAARAGIPIVATDSIPTATAMATAGITCTTLVGLVRSHRRALFVDAGHVGDDTTGQPIDPEGQPTVMQA